MTTILPAPDLDSITVFAGELADAASRITLQYFRKPLDVINKAEGEAYDPVTCADQEAEAEIRRLIAARFPEHGILGEEHGEEKGGNDWVHRCSWVIDPVDGTRAFISGLPLWGTLIAFHDGDRPAVGVIDHPAVGERFVGSPRGAFFTNAKGETRAIRTRSCASLADAILSTTDPDLFAPGEEKTLYDRVAGKVRLRRYGYDCYAYAMLAAGFLDVVVEAGLKP
ncbi:MAG TPA: inositol monophosphatase family protein, partial [Sphingomonadales bacterium]